MNLKQWPAPRSKSQSLSQIIKAAKQIHSLNTNPLQKQAAQTTERKVQYFCHKRLKTCPLDSQIKADRNVKYSHLLNKVPSFRHKTQLFQPRTNIKNVKHASQLDVSVHDIRLPIIFNLDVSRQKNAAANSKQTNVKIYSSQKKLKTSKFRKVTQEQMLLRRRHLQAIQTKNTHRPTHSSHLNQAGDKALPGLRAFFQSRK